MCECFFFGESEDGKKADLRNATNRVAYVTVIAKSTPYHYFFFTFGTYIYIVIRKCNWLFMSFHLFAG